MFFFMPLRIILKFFQRFSYHQQYLVVAFVLFILLIFLHYWWCFILLPLSTYVVYQIINRLTREKQSPLILTGRLYDILIRKRNFQSDNDPDEDRKYQLAIQKECDTYIRTIIARYVCVWYYPFISTDQEFLEDLTMMFNFILNHLSYRLKSLNIHEFSRLIVNLQQIHVDQYLHAYDSYRQLPPAQRSARSVVKEFDEHFHLHPCLIRNDLHSYIRAIIELFLTDLLPESFHLYSGSRTVRELLTQILTNTIFLPLFHRLSQPLMIYHLIVLLWETDEQKTFFENEENRSTIDSENDGQNIRQSTEDIDEQMSKNENENQRENQGDHQRSTPHLERIIFFATILSTERAYNSMSGAAFTNYIIRCQTKSPFIVDEIHDYTIRRRFNEFLNLHKRLQRNPKTSRHCYGFIIDFFRLLLNIRSFVRLELDEIFRSAPVPFDKMNPDVIRRRQVILEQYIQRVISNEVLNCSHDVLEFFAYNTDPNIPYEALSKNWISVPRVDRALLGLFRRSPSRSDSVTPIRERIQLNISTVYDDSCSNIEPLKNFIQQSTLRCSSRSVTLNSADRDFLQLLLTRPSIPKKKHHHDHPISEIPLTDTLLNMAYTCLHSRDAFITNESIHRILRTIFGHFIEKLVKNEIEEILSRDQILEYLSDIRTKVLWPDEEKPFVLMKNVKRRAFYACVNKIPYWLRSIVGHENINRIIGNALQCLSYTELNQHFLCKFFALIVDQLIPNVNATDFLTKYVHMHHGMR